MKGRKRHILVDTFGLLIACRVEPADISGRKATALLLGGLRPLFPNIHTVIPDAGHQSAEFAHHRERSFAWLGRNRRLSRLSKDYEYSVQSSETLIEIAATRLMLNRLAQA